MVTIPGTNQKEELVLNDIKSVTIEAVSQPSYFIIQRSHNVC